MGIIQIENVFDGSLFILFRFEWFMKKFAFYKKVAHRQSTDFSNAIFWRECKPHLVYWRLFQCRYSFSNGSGGLAPFAAVSFSVTMDHPAACVYEQIFFPSACVRVSGEHTYSVSVSLLVIRQFALSPYTNTYHYLFFQRRACARARVPPCRSLISYPNQIYATVDINLNVFAVPFHFYKYQQIPLFTCSRHTAQRYNDQLHG